MYPSSTTYPSATTYPGVGTNSGSPTDPGSGPDAPLKDFQVLWNGLLMGPETNYGLPPTLQFLDLAPIKTMDTARTWADGSWSGPDFGDVYTPQMDVEISAPDDASFYAAVMAFRQAFTPQADALPLWVKLPGFDPMMIYAKTSKRIVPIDLGWGLLSVATVQWRCPDPVWQSAPRVLTLMASGAGTSGLLFPMFMQGVADFGSTAVGASSGVLTNSGNSPAWPIVEAHGPMSSFTIVIDGNSVSYTQRIPGGQSLVVDYRAGTAKLTGGLDRTLSARGFSAVPPGGSSSVFFSADGGSVDVTISDVSR